MATLFYLLKIEKMKQEVEVIVKFTIEVETDKTEENIRNYIRGNGFLKNKYNSLFPYNMITYDIISVREENKIYES